MTDDAGRAANWYPDPWGRHELRKVQRDVATPGVTAGAARGGGALFSEPAKTMFTTADNYVVQIHRPLPEPLRSLVVAAALGVDTALKQDSRGFNEAPIRARAGAAGIP